MIRKMGICAAPVKHVTVDDDCQRCGACCFSTLAAYVRVSGDDYARLGDAAEQLTEFHENRCYMRMTAGHCAALDYDPVRGLFACSVYAHRPDVCRELERGSPACEAERARKVGPRGRTLPVVS